MDIMGLMKILQGFHPLAKVSIVVTGRPYDDISFAWSGAEGEPKAMAREMCICVDTKTEQSDDQHR
uniref:Uncharacterized protein n=1 Tax=viral metagenome TaxID=1070528 RepID=A0A6M3IFS0_9ZZZZ